MPEVAAYVRVDTAGIAPGERFDYWRGMVAPLRLEPVDASLRDFRASAEFLRAGGVGVIEMNRGPAIASWGRETVEAQDRLRLVVLGAAEAAAAHWYGLDVSLARGGVALLGATDGGWRAPAGMRGIAVDLPRAAVAVSDAELDRINTARLLRANPVFTSLIRPALAGMAGHLEVLAGTAPCDFAAVWTSLITMLVRSLTDQDPGGPDVTLARRVEAERFIRAHLSDPRLSPGAVAAALHISRRSLYASFPEGQGIAAYIRRQRLQRARAMLADQQARPLPVAQVGAQVGMPDPAHFSRLFRAEYGRSPRDVRAHPNP
ncbi:MAG: helix-turn-helix domain-containing protein [Streptosporangiaceae bacterium]